MENETLLKELIQSLAKHVREEDFITYCLCFLKTDESKKEMIQYLNSNNQLRKNEIDIKILEITKNVK